MTPDYFLRAGFIISAAFLCGAAEMKRRARVTEGAARRWLDNSGYRVEEGHGIKVNVWANPARVVARADDPQHQPVEVALTVTWFMGGVLGKGEVRCISVKYR